MYVSVDIDVLDPAHAPGTGTPEAGGMTSRELLEIVRGLDSVNLVGVDVVEVSPAYDHAPRSPRSPPPTSPGNSCPYSGERLDHDPLDACRAGDLARGKRCAVAFTFDVDAESPLLTTDPAFADRMGAMSHQAYGPLVGVPRLLSILDELQVPATFFVPGYTAHRHPEPIRSIAAAGHEIAHHGYLHESLVGVDEQTEREILDRGLRALQEVVGVTPVGYRAPMWEMNWHTPKLLAEFGFLYDSTLMDSDHPYELALST